MRRIRTCVIIFLVLFIASYSFGTGSQDVDSSSKPKGGVTLTALTQFGFESWNRVWSETMRAWEKDTGNIVKEESIDWGNFERLIKTGIVSGNPYDLAFFKPENMVVLTRDAMAMDLTPYLEENNGEWKNKFNQNILNIGAVNGHYYNIPIHISGQIMYYNKAIFSKYNITPPVTIDEYIEAGKKLKGTGVALFGIKSNCWIPITRSGLSSSAKIEGVFDDWVKGKVSITGSQIAKRHYEGWVKLLKDPEIVYGGIPGCLNLTADELISAYLKGKVAMLLDNIVLAQFYAIDCKDKDMGVTFIPQLDKQHISVEGGANGYFIPYNTKHPTEAISLMKTFAGDAFQQRCWTELGIVGSFKDLPTPPVTAEVMKYIETRDIIQLSPELNSEIDKSLPNILTGTPIDEELKNLEELRLRSIKL